MASPRTPRTSTTDPIREQMTSRRTIEKKALEFDIILHDVSFNYAGRYFLRLAVQSSFTSDLTSLRVRSGDATGRPTRGFRFGAEARTEVTDQLQQDEVFHMQDARFSFYMPVGFNKNDIKHDVFLLIEAFDISETTAQFRRIGEAKVAIYPRTDVEMNFDLEIGDPVYRLTMKTPILRTNTQDHLHMHCGSLNFTCQLIEAWPIEVDEDGPPEPQPRPPVRKKPPEQLKPPPPPEPTQKQLPERKTPRGDHAPAQRLRENPDVEHRSVDPLQGGCRLVSDEGKEEVTIIVHGGNDMKHPSKHRMPRTYVTVQSKSDEDSGRPAQGVTHSTIKASDSPSWEEMINVVMDANRAPDEVIVIKIGDKDTQELIHEFRIPVGSLQPFHNYHVNMHKFNGEQGRLFATMIRKQAHLHSETGIGINYKALEACLVAVRHPLQNPAGALIAVAKVVSDYYNFVNKLLAYRNSGLELTTAQFPNPHPTTFFVSDRWTGQGQSQVTLPGKPVVQPQWHHPFLFCDQRELATLFTVGAAVVIEFYDFNNQAVNEVEWRATKPVGYAALVLDNKAYRQLTGVNGRKGLLVELPVQGGLLRSSTGKLPTVGLVLRLHEDSSPVNLTPDFLRSPDLATKLPRFDPTHLEVPSQDFVDQEGDGPYEAAAADAKPRAGLDWEWDPYRDLSVAMKRKQRKRLPITDGDLPAENAVESVLPEYDYIFPAPAGHGGGSHRQPGAGSGRRQPQRHLAPLPEASAELGELERYRDAMRKMGQDILALQDRIKELELENSALKRDVWQYGDTQQLLAGDGPEFEDLPKADLIARYAAMKNKLVSTASQVGQYREKVQQLQNELIRQQQDTGRGGAGVAPAHISQQRLIQQLQAKADKVRQLEGACMKQEQVIERMEGLLNGGGGGGGKKPDDTLARALSEENRRLREELSQLRASGGDQRGDAGMDDAERMELYQLLDKAETRISSLEKQVTEKARDWAKEKERLADRLEALRVKPSGVGGASKPHRRFERGSRRREDEAGAEGAAASGIPKRVHRKA